MSTANKSSFKSSNTSSTEALYEDDLLTWLQYPTDDAFERSYCSDVLQGGWPPPLTTTEAAKYDTNADVITHEHKGTSILSMATSICETKSVPYPSLARKHMETKPTLMSKSSCNVNAEEALAQGAARAAGHSLQVGQDAYNKVKTLMQPTHANYPPLSSTPCHFLDACKEYKDHPIKPNFPVSSIPACAPKALKNARGTTPPLSGTKHARFESATSFSKRVRTEYKAHSHTYQTESSRITEEGNIERGTMIMGPDRTCTMTSTSCSGASQSSMSLSGTAKESACSGKRKQEELELLTEEYAADDLIGTKKGSKLLARRNRVAEVHNISERNRRNKINEKLKALQDLIPNSSKTDKASILDEAIEYMKTLQMQLQMVSMRNSLNVSSVMMPMGLPQAHMQMGQPHSIGLGLPIGHAAGMGMGLGVGMPETGHPTTTTLLQCPAAMSQLHAMSFHNGNMGHFAHMGFLQATQISPTMQNIQESYELSAQSPASHMHQHEQREQRCSLLRQPHNPAQEGPIEQDDVPD